MQIKFGSRFARMFSEDFLSEQLPEIAETAVKLFSAVLIGMMIFFVRNNDHNLCQRHHHQNYDGVT